MRSAIEQYFRIKMLPIYLMMIVGVASLALMLLAFIVAVLKSVAAWM